MIPVVIYGIAELSSVTWHYLTHSGRFRVVGFTVDNDYRKQDFLHGLPVVDFETVHEIFGPVEHQMIIPVGWKYMNRLRQNKCEEAGRLGYQLASYIDSKAVVADGFVVQQNTIIQPGAIVAPFAEIGKNCTIRTGSVISHHVKVADHCFIATGATVSGNATIGERSVLGVGCVIRDGVHVAPRSFIGAGAVVVKDTQPDGVYLGVPAKLQATPSFELKEVN
jgi:sugar O-acyltransferase (sialic acid O-acetyltransferase NeuD family)